MIQICANGLDHAPQAMRPIRNALGAVRPSLLSCVGCRDALDLRRDDVELRGQLRVDAQAIGNGANSRDIGITSPRSRGWPVGEVMRKVIIVTGAPRWFEIPQRSALLPDRAVL